MFGLDIRFAPFLYALKLFLMFLTDPRHKGKCYNKKTDNQYTNYTLENVTFDALADLMLAQSGDTFVRICARITLYFVILAYYIVGAYLIGATLRVPTILIGLASHYAVIIGVTGSIVAAASPTFVLKIAVIANCFLAEEAVLCIIAFSTYATRRTAFAVLVIVTRYYCYETLLLFIIHF